MPTLTQERLKELLRYDPETGLFKRLVRLNQFSKVGDIAGFDNGKGYICIIIDKKSYKAHRLAFLYMNGEWPKDQVDHINMVKSDNRWANLREATNSQNMANRRGWGAVLPKGVSAVPSGRYQASILINGKSKYLGLFSTPKEANEAYLMAANDTFGEFARAA